MVYRARQPHPREIALRILHLVSYSLYSGPLPPTLGLALAQRQLGHTVWLAYDRKRGAFNEYEEAAAPWVDPDFDPPVPLTLSTKSSPIEYVRDVQRMRRLVKEEEVDIVHMHMSHDHGLAALAGGRVARIRTFHAERSLIRRFGQSWLNRRADAVIARCHAHRQLLVTRFGFPMDRVHVISGSINSERFAPATNSERCKARAHFALPLDVPVLGHVALIDGRGQEELLDAATALGESALHIMFVGNGRREQALKQRIDNAGLNDRVRLTGYLRGGELLEAYAAMDAAFVAQPGNDASARAALEAMASGLPVLGVQTGALTELVDDAVGYPVSDRRVDSVASAISKWLTAPSAADTRGRAGRAHVIAERTFQREAERTITAYEQVLRERSTRTAT